MVTAVPVDAMLQTADTAITAVDDNPRGGDWPVEWTLNYCSTRAAFLNVNLSAFK